MKAEAIISHYVYDRLRLSFPYLKVLFAFMVGLHNLYWYYGSQTYKTNKGGVDQLVHSSEAFQG